MGENAGEASLDEGGWRAVIAEETEREMSALRKTMSDEELVAWAKASTPFEDQSPETSFKRLCQGLFLAVHVETPDISHLSDEEFMALFLADGTVSYESMRTPPADGSGREPAEPRVARHDERMARAALDCDPGSVAEGTAPRTAG